MCCLVVDPLHFHNGFRRDRRHPLYPALITLVDHVKGGNDGGAAANRTGREARHLIKPSPGSKYPNSDNELGGPA